MSITWINKQSKKCYEQRASSLESEDGDHIYPEDGVYRFCERDNYTENFGFQWNLFAKTQLDDHKLTLSKARFFQVSGWDAEAMSDDHLLEVGSGAGRFTQVIMNHTAAKLWSVDYSSAVDANYKNNRNDERLTLIQASVYELPFKPGQFDKVFCFGVLQHTPDIPKTIEALAKMVKPGGSLAVDFYPIRGWWTKLHAKYFIRPMTRRLSDKHLFKIISINLKWMHPLGHFLNKIKLGRVLNRLLPIVDLSLYEKMSLDQAQIKEWVILDTFDMLSPAYDQPQRIQTVKELFEKQGIDVSYADYAQYGDGLEAACVRGTKAKFGVSI